MKVLLQSRANKLYVKSGKEWTPRPDEAQDFGDTRVALAFYRQHPWPDVQVVLLSQSLARQPESP